MWMKLKMARGVGGNGEGYENAGDSLSRCSEAFHGVYVGELVNNFVRVAA